MVTCLARYCKSIAFKTNLKIVQWNARSAFANHNFFKNLCEKTQFDIGLLCETWYKPAYNVRLTGYSIIRKDRMNGKGGVAIFIKNPLSYKIINFNLNNNNLEVCGANITIGKEVISVVSVYRPPNIVVSSNEYVEIFSKLESTCVIGGDFNGHHTLWGCAQNNPAGLRLLEAVDVTPNLIIRNEGACTRISHNSASALDVTIVSSNLINNSEWTVLDDTYGSDHLPIFYETNKNTSYSAYTSISKWSLRNADWSLYSNILDQKGNDINTNRDANAILDNVIQLVSETADIAFKKVNVSTNKRFSPPWWDEECSNLARERSQALKTYKRTKSLDSFLTYQNISAKSKRIFKAKAKTSWIKYCESLNSQTNLSTIWKRINSVSQGLTNNISNTMSENDAHEFLKKITPDCNQLSRL